MTSEIGNFGEKVASIEIPEIVKPIDETEIQYARAIIRQMHPLRNVGYDVSVPFLSSLLKMFAFLKPPRASVHEERKNLAQSDQLKEDEEGKSTMMSPSAIMAAQRKLQNIVDDIRDDHSE